MSGQTPEQLEAEIAAKREDLAQTVDALAAKLDVKSQAQAKVADIKAGVAATTASAADRATTDSGKPRPELVAGAAAAVVAIALIVWWRRR